MADTKMNTEQNLKMENAAKDIRYLLERDYPRNSVIRFISDHYRLSNCQRYTLARTVFSSYTVTERRSKKVQCTGLNGKKVLIDGYNVIITLENILKGEITWSADDSFLRDIKGVHRNHSNDRFTTEAVEEMLYFLLHANVVYVIILLDVQMTKSGELAAFIRKRMKELLLSGDARTSPHVDYDLKISNPSYIVASADGVVIDCMKKVIDIPSCIQQGYGKKGSSVKNRHINKIC